MSDLKTVDIKGKRYVEVHERIRYFRENFAGYSMITDIIANLSDETTIYMRAAILNKERETVATGHAMEKNDGKNFINKTSHVENCETSAWGRALANFGIGVDSSVASADEVMNAISKQDEKPAKKAAKAPKKAAKKETKVETPPKKVVDSEPAEEDLPFLPFGGPIGAPLEQATIDKMIAAFDKHGVTVEDLEALSQHPVEKWDTNMKEKALEEYQDLKNGKISTEDFLAPIR